MFNVGDTLLKLATESGFAGFFANGGWQNLVMIVIACVLPVSYTHLTLPTTERV